MEITLSSGRKIEDSESPYIIAEAGSNWRDLKDCLNSIVQAKNAGADAVKFQLFTNEDLYGPQCRLTFGRKGHLAPEWLPKLKEHSDRAGIDFMCTAFSPDLYDLVDPFVEMHKVASAEMCHLRIHENLRGYRKPIILSTGAQSQGDIASALGSLGYDMDYDTESNPRIILLYCVAAYPAKEVDLGRITALKTDFGVLTGFSDHTTDVLVIPRAAAQAGAVVIEKHFTTIPEIETPDRAHSLNPSELRRMVQSIRGEPIASRGASEELPMVLRHKRRLIAMRDIAMGDIFKEGENFGIYRSLKDDTHALHPFAVNHVSGKRAARPICAGDGIGPGDFT